MPSDDDNNSSSKEPLRQFLITTGKKPTPPPPLHTLPEDGEISIPIPLTPSEFKDRLIFGPSPCSPRDASSFFDAFSLSPPPPPPPLPPIQSSSSSTFDDSSEPLLQPPLTPSHDALFRNPNFERVKGHPLHRSKTAPAMAVINDLDHRIPEKPKFASRSVVRQAFALLLVYLSLGVLIYWINRDKFTVHETHPVVDALYFCIVTMCTIGYGDITPNSTSTKLFSILFVLVGFGFIDILLSGMVTYVLDLQESYMLKAVKPGVEQDKARSYIIDVKKGRMRIRLKVGLALGVVVICIGIGVVIMHFVEKVGLMDSFYLSVMSVTTVGYGDRAFKTLPGRIFAAVWLLVSTLAVARAFLYLAEARVDKRNRRMVKWVLGQSMTVSQFLAADIDNNGFVSKSEYVIYKLKEMGKLTEKDIVPIGNQFDRIDTGNLGKISLADLMQSNG